MGVIYLGLARSNILTCLYVVIDSTAGHLKLFETEPNMGEHFNLGMAPFTSTISVNRVSSSLTPDG